MIATAYDITRNISDIDRRLDQVPAAIARYNAAAKIARNIADALDGKYYTRRLDNLIKSCAVDGYAVTGGSVSPYHDKAIQVIIRPSDTWCANEYITLEIGCSAEDRRVNGEKIRERANYYEEHAAQLAESLAAYAVNRALYEQAAKFVDQLERAIMPLGCL